MCHKNVIFNLHVRQQLLWLNPSIVLYLVCYEFFVHSNADKIMFLLSFVLFLVYFFFCYSFCHQIKRVSFDDQNQCKKRRKYDVLSSPFRIDYTHSLPFLSLTQWVRLNTDWNWMNTIRFIQLSSLAVKNNTEKIRKYCENHWKTCHDKTK